jgi:hypothetical protein
LFPPIASSFLGEPECSTCSSFDKHQKPVEPGLQTNLNRWVGDSGVTDLIVLSHGWNNNMAEARQLYAELAASIVAQRDSGSGGEAAMNWEITRIASFVRLHPLQPRPVATVFARLTW